MDVISQLSLLYFCLTLRVMVRGCDDVWGYAQSWTSNAFTKIVEYFTPCVCDTHKHLVLIWWYGDYFIEVYQTTIEWPLFELAYVAQPAEVTQYDILFPI